MGRWNMKWPVRVTAKTVDWDGKIRKMDATVDGEGLEPEEVIMAALNRRRDKGRPFCGCEIAACTPLGQKVIRVLDPDTGKLI